MSAFNPTMWPYDYAQGMKVVFLKTVLNSLITTANKAEAMFCNILCKGMILH